MGTKDRLEELHSASAGAGGGQPRESGESGPVEALEAPDAHAAEIEQLLQEVERVRVWVSDVVRDTQLVRRLHRDQTFHTNTQLQQQLDAAATRSAAAGLKVCGALRQLEARAGAARGVCARVTRLQLAATRRLYADALRDHYSALHALRQDRHALLHKQMQLNNLEISEDECESLLESNNIALFVGNVRAETAEARRALRDVEARHEELMRVEGSLRALRDLFTQLAHLVAAQQEQVDTVEYYALSAGERVQDGGQELMKGSVTRRRATKKKISLIICLVSGFLLVLLVLVLT